MRSILLRQHEGAFGFRSKRTVEPGAAAVDAATDLEPQAEQPVHSHHGAPVGVVAGQLTAARRTAARRRLQRLPPRRPHRQPAHLTLLSRMRWHPQQRVNFAVLEKKGEAQLVAVADGRERARITHDGYVTAVAFSPDGQTLATASADGMARLVAVADGRERTRIIRTRGLKMVAESREIARITHDDSVYAVAFSPDGQTLATASLDKT